MIDTAAWNVLKNTPAVTAIIGAGAAARLHHIQRPQGQRIEVAGPTIVVIASETDYGHDLDGPDGTRDGTVDVVCLARTKDDCDALAKAAAAALEFTGKDVPGGTILLSEVQGDTPVLPAADYGAELPSFGRSLTVHMVGFVS